MCSLENADDPSFPCCLVTSIKPDLMLLPPPVEVEASWMSLSGTEDDIVVNLKLTNKFTQST